MSQHFTILYLGGHVSIEDLTTACGLMCVDPEILNHSRHDDFIHEFQLQRLGSNTPNPRTIFTLRSDCPDPGHAIFGNKHVRPDPHEILAFLTERSIAFLFTWRRDSHVWQHGPAKMALCNPLLTPDGPITCWCDNGSVPLIPAREVAQGQPLEEHPAMIVQRLREQHGHLLAVLPDVVTPGITDHFADPDHSCWPGTFYYDDVEAIQ